MCVFESSVANREWGSKDSKSHIHRVMRKQVISSTQSIPYQMANIKLCVHVLGFVCDSLFGETDTK